MLIHFWKSRTEKTIFSFNGITTGDVVMKQTLSMDDNINIFIKKLFVYLNKYHKRSSENELYFWFEDSIKVSKYMLINFINHVFKTSNSIDNSYFIQCINNYFNLKLNGEKNFIIDKNDALKYMLSIKDKLSTIVEPLLFKYTENGFDNFINYNPLSSDDYSNEISTSSLNNFDSLTLNSFKLSSNAKIHMITTNLSNVPSYFFPYKDQKTETLETLKPFITGIDKVEDDIMNNKNANDYNHITNINYLQIKVNETNFNTKVNLKDIFDNLLLTEDIPFIKYRAKTNIYYKFYKPSILNIKSDVYEWVDAGSVSSSIRNYTISFITIKVKYNNTYCTLTIYEDLNYDIKFNFGMKNKDTIKNIIEFSKSLLNPIIEKIQLIYPKQYIPILDIDKNILESPDVRLVQIITANSISLENKKIKYENLNKVVQTFMYPFFNIINNPDKSILHLQYKKVDNYTKYDNIQAYITNHFTFDKEEMVSRIMSAFTISKDNAVNELDKWMSTNEVELTVGKDKVFVKPKNTTFVNIKIRLDPSSIDLKYLTYGVKDISMQDKITYLLKVLMDLSKKTTSKEIDIDTFDKLVYKNDSNIITFEDLNKETNISETIIEEDIVDNEDAIELDEDLLALEKEFLAGMEEESNDFSKIIEETPKNQANITTKKQSEKDKSEEISPSDDNLKGYILNKLYEADEQLFRYKVPPGKKRKDYASVCQWTARQQPIAISEAEYNKITKTFPKALSGYVKTGSTPELKKKNFYVCPKIWCPISRVALSYEDYVKNGNKCPYPEIEEDPILFESKNFWGVGDKALQRDHHPGFLDPFSHHPDKLCLPCCYKKEGKEGTRHKQRIDYCMPPEKKDKEINEEQNKEKDKKLKEDIDIVGNEKYIKTAEYIPLETSRFGLLKPELSNLFGSKVCGPRHDGTGIIGEETNCILRRGVNQKQQSFMSAIIPLLDNADIKDIESLKKSIVDNLTIQDYISLDNGKLMKLFIMKNYDIYNKTAYIQFKSWFLAQQQYIKIFGLQNVEDEIKVFPNYDKDNMPSYKEILREFLIYNSYNNFIEYIKNDDELKDHRTLLDLITLNDNINIHDHTFMLIDYDIENDKYYIECPFNRNVKNFVNLKNPFVFILKIGKYYEHIVNVHMVNKDLQVKYKFNFGESKEINDIINFYFNNCSFKDNTNEDKLIIFLEKNGYKVKLAVIDYSFRVKGIILKNNLYIPFEVTQDLINIPNNIKLIYISDLIKYKCTLDKSAISSIYNKINKYIGNNFYEINSYVLDNDKITSLLLKDNILVPINISKDKIIYKSYGDDLNIFLNIEMEDTRTSLMKIIEDEDKEYEKVFLSAIDAINNNIELKKELQFLLDNRNPFPIQFKREKIFNILKKLKIKVPNKLLERIGEMLVYNKTINFYILKQKFKVADDEIFMEHGDIVNKKLDEIIEYQKDPFRVLNERLNLLMESYTFDSQEFIRETFDQIISEGKLIEPPVKWRKVLKGFNLLDHINYDNQYLYRFFSKLVTVLDSRKLIMPEDIKAIIQTDLVYDYENDNLEYLYENSSFQEHIKKMKISKPNIEDILSIFNSVYYYPSIYEISKAAKMLGINFYITRRKNKADSDDVVTIRLVKGKSKNKYILMNQSYDRLKKCDIFELYVLKNNIILHRLDLSKEFWSIV